MNRTCRSFPLFLAAAVMAAPMGVFAAGSRTNEPTSARATAAAPAPPYIPRRPRKSGSPPAPSGAPVRVATKASPLDLNTASEPELRALPGVGLAYARKIVAARPFASVADLSRAGLPKGTVEKITPLVKVTGAGGASTPMGAGDRPMSPAPPKSAAPRTFGARPAVAGGERGAGTPPMRGMVWLDTDAKVYHAEGDAAYGRTKHGRWTTESEAVREGYRKAGKD